MKFPWVFLLLLAGVAMTLAPAVADAQEKPAADQDLAAKVQAALDQPRAQLAPPVLVFPLVDAERRLVKDGVFWSHQVSLALVYGPARRMALSVPRAQQVLVDHNVTVEGTRLTDDLVRQCTAATDQPYYVVPSVREGAGKLTFELAFFGNGREKADKQFRREFTTDQRTLAMTWCVETIFEHLGRPLSDEERDRMTRSVCRSSAEYEELLELTRQPLGLPEVDARLRAFLTRNPQCVYAWERFLSFAKDKKAALDALAKAHPEKLSERLLVQAAVRQRDLGQPKEALQALLPFVSTHFDDCYFQASLLKCAMAIDDRELITQLFTRWRADDTGYAASFERGDLLIGWAWQARGVEFAYLVPPENMRLFLVRLKAARGEFEHALQVNPDGWSAHTRILTVAMGLGMDREEYEQHFAAAVRLQPGNAEPYRAKFTNLEPKWHGSPGELLEFGQQCLKTKRWKEGIAPLFLEAVEKVNHMTRDPALFFRSDEIWAQIKESQAQAKSLGTEEQQHRANSLFALAGGMSGRYDEVRPIFDELANRLAPIDKRSFQDGMTFLRLRSAVWGASPRDNSDKLSGILAAMLSQPPADVEQQLNSWKPDSIQESQSIQFYRRALALVRSLQQERRVVLEGKHWRHATLDHDDYYSLEPNYSGTVEGDRYSWTIATRNASDKLALAFPAMIDQGTIKGRVRWTPGTRFVLIGWRLASGGLPSYLVYYVADRKLVYTAGMGTRHSAMLDLSELDVRITCGADIDKVEINDQLSWEAENNGARPGLLSIQGVLQRDAPGTFTIEPFEIVLDK
jgi:tetratricopeptide (TPR) repeat protein